MVQTKDYIIGPDFIAWNKKIDERDADTLLELACNADAATFVDIRRLIMDPRSYGPKVLISNGYDVLQLNATMV